MRLDGKAALVTGAGGGLGGATARGFAAEGAAGSRSAAVPPTRWGGAFRRVLSLVCVQFLCSLSLVSSVWLSHRVLARATTSIY